MYTELREVWDSLTTEPTSPFHVGTAEVRGQQLRTFTNAPPSLREIWLASAAHGDADYLVYEDERWTYAEAHQQVASIANWFASQGVVSGDRIAIAMRNYPEWLLVYWACVSTGISVVGMNAWWIGPEMVYGLQDSAPKVLVADAERLERALQHRDEIPEMVMVGVRIPGDLPDGVLPYSDLLEVGGTLPEVSIDPEADAQVFYTSGTTGRPKGAQLTHRGCVNNIMNLGFWASAYAGAKAKQHAAEGSAPAPASGESLQPSALVITPLFHVTANNCVAHAMTAAGGKLVHLYKWDAGVALKAIEAEKITNMSGVPVMSRELIAHPDFATTDTSSLEALGGGGAQLQPDLVEKIDTSDNAARPSTGYGMTETCGVITAISADFFVDRPASAGPILPTFEAKCVDDEGNAVPLGQRGELWVKGAPVIRGYLNRPEATAEAITDGWLHTGDIAYLDEDGFVYIVDRAKDMVIRGGENVYCAEVESALFDHEGVAECTVFGVDDDRLGEEVGAAVLLAPDAGVSGVDATAMLRDHCAGIISKHKIPRYIWLMDEALPRNASGKFLKRQLKEDLDTADAL